MAIVALVMVTMARLRRRAPWRRMIDPDQVVVHRCPGRADLSGLVFAFLTKGIDRNFLRESGRTIELSAVALSCVE